MTITIHIMIGLVPWQLLPSQSYLFIAEDVPLNDFIPFADCIWLGIAAKGREHTFEARSSALAQDEENCRA